MNVRPLSAALRKKAEEEINEDFLRVPADLRAIREWLEEQPHLRSIKMTDQWLMAFLRGTKFNLDKCKSKLENYYSLKFKAPEFFGNRDPFDPGIQELLKLGIFLPLRRCAEEDSPRVCMSRIGLLCKAKRPLTDLIKLAFMIIEILLIEDDNFTVAGQEVISDTKDASITYLVTQWTPSMAKKTFLCAEKALTVRMGTTCVVNAPRGLKTLVNVCKMFLGTKIRNRIHIFNESFDDLYDILPESVLPVEYGGYDGTVQELTDHWKAKVESYRDWFLNHGTICVEDDGTSHGDKNSSNVSSSHLTEISTVEKSLKKLEID